MSVRLDIKLDGVAVLRAAGDGAKPDPAVAASLVELAGADGVTMHLHSDRSTIKMRDLQVIRETVGIPLNLELAVLEKMREHALELHPSMVTMVAEPLDVTSDRNVLELAKVRDLASSFAGHLKDSAIGSCVFIPAELEAVKLAKRFNADMVMLDTTPFTRADKGRSREHELQLLENALRLARKLDMGVRFGGGISYNNAEALAQLKPDTIVVGHGVMARAILMGIDRAVGEMVQTIARAG